MGIEAVPHRNRQRKMVNSPLRAICRALDRSFSLSCSSSSLFPSPILHSTPLSERRGRSLNRARTQTRAQIFRCRFNPACMTNCEFFRAPFRPPSRFFPIFPLLLLRPQPCSLATLSIGVRKKLLRPIRESDRNHSHIHSYQKILSYSLSRYRYHPPVAIHCHIAASIFRSMLGEISDKRHIAQTHAQWY
jgi:hypothetical protein